VHACVPESVNSSGILDSVGLPVIADIAVLSDSTKSEQDIENEYKCNMNS
jgi:hypothetical protein